MTEDRILYLIALPIILVFVFGEFLYRKNEKQNTWANLSSNLLCGLIDRLFFLFFGIIQYESMSWLSQFALFESISNKLINAILLFLVVDFVWYLYHRTAHTLKLFWAFHATHHQTDDFNFSLGLRVSFMQQIIRTFFWLPIALLGFDPIFILIAIFFQNFYQFFIHTELFDFPKITRGILVTPKAHLLHHSNQKVHHNKNFGGVLLLWDRLLGSYKSPYTNAPVYLKTQNDHDILSPFNAYFLPFLKMFGFKKKKVKTNDNIGSRSLNARGKKMFGVLILLAPPSILLIFTAKKLGFATVILFSIGMIVIAFISAHLSFSKTSD